MDIQKALKEIFEAIQNGHATQDDIKKAVQILAL